MGHCSPGPFFQQGGRYSLDNIHSVQEGDMLVPASQTRFAQDATLGYKHSNLRKHILDSEKRGHGFDLTSFLTLTLNKIRIGGPEAVAQKRRLSLPVNKDTMIIIILPLRLICTTAAAFVSSQLDIEQISPITPGDLNAMKENVMRPQPGGLILRESRAGKLTTIELEVTEITISTKSKERAIGNAATEADRFLAAGEDVLMMRSRKLIRATDALESIKIGAEFAASLVALVAQINTPLRYMIAKGGITSPNAAIKSLRMKRTKIQLEDAPGVQLWRCDEETSRYPGMPFVVFPGNVGADDRQINGYAQAFEYSRHLETLKAFSTTLHYL
ncbi:hypothetical protein N7528_009231 [Penicillium herquei]|nr:hypothetical protein N7528_009231 [Penicillium herquei]